ncbi:hypothetical protein [uncultured Flavonifractor sp.]|uniref:hypothetical protein n=1 Tax=uncultured Flavonifractor sp. TaxID=1193534 RepID=UPI00260437A6|nr:hypothetical protein [uncultured Flavonifractor sp.]
MLRKDQFGIVFNTIFAIVFAIVLPLYIDGSNMYREAGMILWGPLLQQVSKDFIIGFAVSFTIGTYIDLKAMGDSFARLCGVKNENGLLFHILRVASIAFVMVVLMSLIMMFITMGYVLPVGTFFMGWLMNLPLTYVVALVVAFVTFAIGMPITIALCQKPPKMMPHH